MIFYFWFSSSSIINIPGESTLRRDFLRLQLANKERSELIRRQQLEQQQNEEHKRQLLAERQKRIEEQKEQRRRLEEVAVSLCFYYSRGIMHHIQKHLSQHSGDMSPSGHRNVGETHLTHTHTHT